MWSAESASCRDHRSLYIFLSGIPILFRAKSTSWDAVRRVQFFHISRRGKNRKRGGKRKAANRNYPGSEISWKGESRSIGDITMDRDKDGSLSEAKKNTSAVGLATAETRSRVARPRQVRSNKKEEIVAPKGVLHRLFSGYLFISRRSFNHHR